MSGKGKKSNWSAVAPASDSKNVVMKLAWWWKRQPGGSVNIGFAALPNAVALTKSVPPCAFSTAVPNSSNAALMAGSVHGVVPATQPS